MYPAKVSLGVLPALLLALALSASLGAAPAAPAVEEYFTEAELDLIREAQEIRFRVPTYLKLAERRLIFLGVMEKSKEVIEKERKERERREKELKKNPKAADKLPPVDELAYLDEFTPAELLRGYVQALDEVMANIDDAYERRGDVRGSLEDLEKFTVDTIPLLEKYKPRNSTDRAALEDAIEKAKQAQTDSRDALKVVPKTEKKRTP
jgi:hypothetical protein